MGMEFYGEYLRWFRSHTDGYAPQDIDAIPQQFLFAWTVYECPTYVIDEGYFITWLRPNETKTGSFAYLIFARADMRMLEENGDVSYDAVETSYRCIAQT